MKRNCCSNCGFKIETHDFYMETRSGKICSDCLIGEGTVLASTAHLFKLRGPKGKVRQKGKERASVIQLPLKEAL